MSKKLWTICLKWGVVLGAALAVLELVKMASRNVNYGSTQVFDLAMIIGYILILYAGVKEFKEAYHARLSFSKALMASILVSVIGSLILFGYDMVHYTFIEKDGLQKKYDTALANYRKVVDNDTVTADELTFYLDTVKAMITDNQAIVLADSAMNDSIVGKYQQGVDMISRFYAEKIALQRGTDTANNYRLGNFSNYGRRLLMETLSLYSAQNEDEASTPFVQDVFQQTERQLADVNLAEIRFDSNKDHVPHYEKPGRFAAICAMMDILYGVFFGIFIALYHFRSKNAIEDAQASFSQNQENSEIEDDNLKNA